MRIAGGQRIRNIQVIEVRLCDPDDPDLADCMQVTVDKAGDFSIYTLCLVEVDKSNPPADQPLEGFDPRYACVDFSFKANCSSDLDCQAVDTCPPRALVEPEIDYLAKDYASFRQLILDRLATTSATTRTPLRPRPTWKRPASASPSVAMCASLTTQCMRAATPAPGSLWTRKAQT